MKLSPKKTHHVIVTFDVNETVEYSYVKSFITDALESWGGQFHPDDELFGSLENVKVTYKKDL